MRFHYDDSNGNPRNPNRPPKRVTAGNRAADEMTHLWLQVLPRGRGEQVRGGDHVIGDRRRELEEALLHHRLEKRPEDPSVHLNLGARLLSRLKTQEGIDELETAIRLNARSAEAHDMLGSALRSVGRTQDAMQEFRRALAIDSHYINARYNLATALARTGRFEEATRDFRQVIAAFPNDARLRNEWGEILAGSGDLAGARAQFEKALALDPAIAMR